MDELMTQINNPHPTWIVIGTVEGERRSQYFRDPETAKAFSEQLSDVFKPVSTYKVELVAERA